MEHGARPSPVVAALRRRAWIVVVCAVLVAVGAYAHARRAARTYSATAELLFNSNSPEQQLLGLPSALASQDPATSQADDVQLASLPILTTLTAKALGSSAAAAGIDVTAADAGASDVVNITARSSDSTLAARIANTYSQQLVNYRQGQQLASINKAVIGVQAQVARESTGTFTGQQRQALLTTLSQLESLQAIKPVDVQLMQSAAAPTSSSGSHTARDGALGLIIGLVLGVILALLVERYDPRLHSAATLMAADSVGVAPWPTRVARLTRARLAARPSPAAGRALATIMRRARRRRSSVGAWRLLITSLPERVEGDCRSAVAWELACSAAVVNGGGSSAFVALDPDVGWVSALASDTTAELPEAPGDPDLDQLIRTVWVSSGHSEERAVDVVLGYQHRPSRGRGRSRDRDRDRDRDRHGDLARSLIERYDYLIIDAPSAEHAAAAGFPIDSADAVAVTARLHRSGRNAAQMLVDELAGDNAGGVTVIACPVARNGKGRTRPAPISAVAPTRA